MKNFMVIDGAVNSTFDVFCVDEEMFEIVFPNETDVAFWMKFLIESKSLN